MISRTGWISERMRGAFDLQIATTWKLKSSTHEKFPTHFFLSPAALRRGFLATVLGLTTCLVPTFSNAADGCTVLLCLAGNWSAIPACVPPVREALRDLMLGRGFPTCAMVGSDNSASMSWSNPATCPEMYSRYNPMTDRWEGCSYAGSIRIRVKGEDWSEVWWSVEGWTSTRYTPIAAPALGRADEG